MYSIGKENITDEFDDNLKAKIDKKMQKMKFQNDFH